MEISKLTFGQIRVILTIAKQYDLSFYDIYFQECNSLKEFSEYCEYILRERAEMMVSSPKVNQYERQILEDYYYHHVLLSVWGDEKDFPYTLYIPEYNLILEIPIEYNYREEQNIDLDCIIISIYYHAIINSLGYD